MKVIKKILIAALLVASFTLVFKTADVSAKTPKQHTVTFLYGTKAFAEPVAHGGIAIAPTDTYVPGYNFTGWVGNLFNVTEDRVILGSYAKIAAPSVVYVNNCSHHDDCDDHDHDGWHFCWIHGHWYWDECWDCKAAKLEQKIVSEYVHKRVEWAEQEAEWAAEAAAAEREAERREWEARKHLWKHGCDW